MNTVIPSYTLFAPHLLENPRQSPQRQDFMSSTPSSSRKRKADSPPPQEDRMSTSPTASPSVAARILPRKRARNTAVTGRPLDLPRLLETLSPTDLRSLLTQICTSHPQIAAEIVSTAPRPTLDATLALLAKYESALKEAFPFGTRPASDYAYNRVRAPLHAMLDAVRDFTPHFLPPQEPQPSVGLVYLDAVTQMLHRIPRWDNTAHLRSTEEAYEDLAAAWAAVLREAGKRGAGFQLQFGGWQAKLDAHDREAGGRMAAAVAEMRRVLGWTEASNKPAVDERRAVREALFGGSYGPQVGVGGSQW